MKIAPFLRLFLLVEIVTLTACGQADLSRSQSESAIAGSQKILALTEQVSVVATTIEQGRSQGLWDIQQSGAPLLSTQAGEEIASVSNRYIVPVKKPQIKVTVTGIADSS